MLKSVNDGIECQQSSIVCVMSDVKSLLSVIQDSNISHDDVAAMDECLTPPHSSLNSSTGSPCSTVTDSQGPQSPLFQEDLSPVAIEGTSFVLLVLCLYLALYCTYCFSRSPSSSTGSHCSTVADGRGTQTCLFKENLSPVAIEGTSFVLFVLCLYLALYCTYCSL